MIISYANGNNQLTHVNGVQQYWFDQIGRVRQKDTEVLQYGVFNNMTGYGSFTYQYDAENNRVKKVENGVTTYYLRSSLNVLAEYDGNWNVKSEYLYGVSGMVAQMDADGRESCFLKDWLGNTRQLSGANLRRDYFPFGDHYIASGDGTSYLFTGKELDEGTGLSYFGARYYDPSIGRWLSVDPLMEKYPSLSPYNYCANNPVIHYDPDGRFIGTAIGTIVGSVGGAINAYINDKDVLAGALEGGTAGFIAGGAVDLAIATGGGSLIILGAAVAGGTIGSAFGDIVGQVTEKVHSEGQSLSEVTNNIDLNQTFDKAKTGAVTGLVGGTVAVGMNGLGTAVVNATKGLQSSMSQTVNTVAKTTGSFSSKGVQEVAKTMGEIGNKVTNAMLKIEAGSAVLTETGLNILQNNLAKNEEED